MISKLISDELLQNMPKVGYPLPGDLAEMSVVCKIDCGLPDWETFYVAGKHPGNDRLLVGCTAKGGKATAQTISLSNLENGGDLIQIDSVFPSTMKFEEVIDFSTPEPWRLR